MLLLCEVLLDSQKVVVQLLYLCLHLRRKVCELLLGRERVRDQQLDSGYETVRDVVPILGADVEQRVLTVNGLSAETALDLLLVLEYTSNGASEHFFI